MVSTYNPSYMTGFNLKRRLIQSKWFTLCLNYLFNGLFLQILVAIKGIRNGTLSLIEKIFVISTSNYTQRTCSGLLYNLTNFFQVS